MSSRNYLYISYETKGLFLLITQLRQILLSKLQSLKGCVGYPQGISQETIRILVTISYLAGEITYKNSTELLY